MSKGLAILLEQTTFKKIKVNNGLLDFTQQQGSTQQQISSANLRDVSISQIARGLSNPLKMGEQANAVARIKNTIQYDKDKTVNFDSDFENFLKQYQKSKGLPQTGEIDKELSCHLYPTFCTQQTQSNGTTTTSQKQESEVVKYLNKYMNRFSPTEPPTRYNCVVLIDNYVTQAKNYRLGQSEGITANGLAPFKKQIKVCKRFHPSLTFKFKSMIEITKDTNSPFYIDINNSGTGTNTNQTNNVKATKKTTTTTQTNTSYDNDVNDFKNFLINNGFKSSEVGTAKEITIGSFSVDYEGSTYKYNYNDTKKTFELDKNYKPQKIQQKTAKTSTSTQGQTVTPTNTQKDADEPNNFGPNKKTGEM